VDFLSVERTQRFAVIYLKKSFFEATGNERLLAILLDTKSYVTEPCLKLSELGLRDNSLLKNLTTFLQRSDFVVVPPSKEHGKLVHCFHIQEHRLIVRLEVKTMSLRALAYEEVSHEPCCKTGKLRVKKRVRLHAIEEFAAQQLVVLPILTSPSPLSPENLRQTFFMVCSSVQCCFIKSVSLVLMLACFPLFVGIFGFNILFIYIYIYIYFFFFFFLCFREITF